MKALPLRLAHQGKTTFYERAVFAGEWRHIHHSADRDQVEPLVEINGRIGVGSEPCFSQLECKPYTRELLIRVWVC